MSTIQTFSNTPNHEKKVKLLDSIFANMSSQSAGNTRTGIMLTGDPGTGKTSAVRELSRLLGIKLITIEAPHITEEHIINIPFIVFDPKNESEKRMNQAAEAESNSYKIVLSDSHLFSQLQAANKIQDKELLKYVYNDENLKSIWEELGGTEKTIPDDIQTPRQKIKVVLFLDEYFRNTSVRIRNMLRNILNGKLGVHDIPKDVYVIFASNMTDSGLDSQASNADFLFKEVGTPNKEEWFNWLVNKFKKDQKVKLDKHLIDTFFALLEDADINHNDVNKEVRVSPRRWEQLLLYINSSLPCKDEADARALLTNISVNFKSFTTNEEATILNKVLKATTELIKKTSKIEIAPDAKNSEADWRSTLEHQIVQKMKLGKHRSYIPVIAGAPGIVKTSEMANIALDLKLRYIHIDCSTLDPEDVIGLPLASGKEKITTQFSTPKLYKYIIDECKKQESEYLGYLKKHESKDDIKKYEDQEYKYLVFFDELNRVGSIKVFNALRQVLLEKKFGDDHTLPEGTIIVSALNPADIGVNELTGHIKDVVDIIGSSPSWKLVKSYLTEKVSTKHLKHDLAKTASLHALLAFVEKFKMKSGDVDQRPFHLNAGASDIYISPREYTTLFSHSAELLDRKLKRLKDLSKELSADERKKVEHDLREALYTAYEETLSSIFNKHGTSVPEFMHDLKHWFLSSSDIDIGEDLFYKKVKTAGINSILNQYVKNPKLQLEKDADFVSYIEGTDIIRFKEDMLEFLTEQLKSAEDITKHVGELTRQERKLNDKGEIEEMKNKVSTLEHLVVQILHAIKIHGLSNDRSEHLFGALKESFRIVFAKIMKENPESEHEMTILNFLRKLKKIIITPN